MSHTARHSEAYLSYRSNWLRAAVLGANDGILSVSSLLLGVAASGASRSVILTAGIAGLVAGASSMAAGEYVSVSSQRDTERADLRLEERELRNNPEGELRELTGIYERRGRRQRGGVRRRAARRRLIGPTGGSRRGRSRIARHFDRLTEVLTFQAPNSQDPNLRSPGPLRAEVDGQSARRLSIVPDRASGVRSVDAPKSRAKQKRVRRRTMKSSGLLERHRARWLPPMTCRRSKRCSYDEKWRVTRLVAKPAA